MAYGRPTRLIVEEQLLGSPLQTVSPLASARWAELGWDTVSFAGHEIQTWEQTRHPGFASQTASPIAPTPSSTRRPSRGWQA